MVRFKKHFVHLFIWWILLLSVMTAKANGGGAWIDSPVFSVGNPVFRDIPEVSILSERLYIKFGHSHSDIRVKYILWNHSDKDFKDIDYAFPVDFVNGNYEKYGEFMWNQKPVNYIEFIADGKTLSYWDVPEDTLIDKRTEENDEVFRKAGWGYLAYCVHRKWFYSKFSIPKQSFLTLEVNYSVDSPYFGDGDIPYEYDGGVINILNYDFSPASHWGDGNIRDFYVQLDASELELAGLKPVLKTMETDFDRNIWNWDSDVETIWVSGLQFKGEGPVYTCHIRNFDLTKSKPLRIDYYHPTSFHSLLDCYVPHNAYRMSVSSEQKDYPAGNLTDMDPATCWVPAHKGGIGDWIEFDFKEKDSLERVISLFWVNGYHKSQSSYEQNNRVKRIKATLTHFPDEDLESRVDSFFITWPDAPYQPVYLTTIPYQSTSVQEESYFQEFKEVAPVYDLFLQEFPVKTIRFTIMDVYKGTKYDDTCISEILLFRNSIYNRYLPAFYDRYRKQ